MKMCCQQFLFLVLLELLICCHGQDKSDLKEPHAYTISFFQFNPKDIGVGETAKRQAKKDIKTSDILPNNLQDKHSKLPNNIEKGNLTQLNVTFNGTSDLEKVKEWKDITNNSRIVVSTARSNVSSQTNESFSSANETENKNVTKEINQTQSVKDQPSQRSSIPQTKNHVNKKNTLNPNPQPSLTEAELNLKAPTHQVATKPEKATTPVNVYTKNTTKVEQTKASNSEVKVSENLQKTGEKNMTKQQDDKATKLEKDKKRNEDILRNAKKIKPVQNMVDLKPFNSSIHPILPPEKNHLNQTQNNVIQRSKMQNNSKASSQNKHTSLNEHKSINASVHTHREKAKSLLPNFAEAHKENFQLGSLKHPRHDLYPVCHQCSKNSTYKSCVRKSNLRTCNHDLQNICYSKSSKREGVISYEMGCMDHKACKTARAYPCKDGSAHCFFCCQFNQCNSSPHHGNFELDEINLDELKLDTNNGNGGTTPSKANTPRALGVSEIMIVQAILLVLNFLIL